ncbi:MAG: TonB-dependent siderophore receptor [Aquabacterium sp.]|uniref:TonB-dependent siderophore receptor n=1 Tax=Aquabacterium sp. TaxID=1872578 RepID=UPI00271E838D|nr:TonB-dependent siderophore receptor [Aquabacterium sp.]MDO9002582.1 TonB-dependent siderophore receptor [Aquabacterium sp.]
MRQPQFKLAPITLASWLLMGFSTMAHAQSSVGQNEAPGDAAAALPTVTVTGVASGSSTEGTGQYTTRALSIGKAVQSPRETPQSVSVITRQQLDDRNFTKLEDAVKQTTGINITRLDGAGNYNTIQSRGFDIGAIQLDGIPIPQGANYATAMDTAIYDHIEVLRGPAGLLQGAGEPGGAINLVRKRALGRLAVGANAVGSFDFKRADVDVTGPLNEAGTLRGRVVGVIDRRNSHVDTVFNHKQLGYGTLEFDITPATTLSVGYTQQEVRAAIDQGLPTFADGRLLEVPRSTLAGLRANRQDLDTKDIFLELEHRLDDGGLLKFSARDVWRSSFYRAARANSPVAANGDIQLQTVDFLQENQDRNYDVFFTRPIKLGGLTHRILVGASYNESKAYGGNFVYGPLLAFNVYQPNYDLPYPVLTLPGYNALTTRREKAIYGQAQISATDRLKFLLGGRMSWAEVTTTALRADPGRHFTPSVSSIYDLNQALSAYAAYSETFVVQSALNAASRILPPRTGSQIEFGLKGEFFNKRLQTHAAIFRIEDKDRAITDPAATNASIPGGEVRSQGFEAEVSGKVARGWDVLAGYAYTDTEYVKAPVTQLGQVFSAITPRHSVNLSTKYALANLGLPAWTIGGGVSYRSEFFSQSGTVRVVSGDYSIFNAQVGYKFNDQLSLNLNVDNLFDKTYYDKVSAPSVSLSRQNYYGEPRRVVLALQARY